MKPTTRFSRPIVVGIIATVLAACGQVQPMSLTPTELSTNAKPTASTLGSLELRIAGLGGRRVLATVEEIADLKVTIDYTDSDEFVSRTVDAALLVAAPGNVGRVNFTDLTAGAVTVTVEAFDAANQSIGRESRDTVIVAMQAAHVTIPLKLDATIKDSLNGNLAVDINATDGDVITRSPAPNRPTESGRPELPDWSPSPTASDSGSPVPIPSVSPIADPASSPTPRPLPSDYTIPPGSTLTGTLTVPESTEPLWFSIKLSAMRVGEVGFRLDEWISPPRNVKPGSDIFITVEDRSYGWYTQRQKVYRISYVSGWSSDPSPRIEDVWDALYEPTTGEHVLPEQSGVSRDFENAKRGMWDFLVINQ